MNLVNVLLALHWCRCIITQSPFIIADPKQYLGRVSHINRSLVTVAVYSWNRCVLFKL